MTGYPSAQIAALETPCLLLDRGIMDRNIERMHAHLRRGGVPLRPHVKTTKCIEIARRMTRGQPGGITVSTLAEAEHFAAAGFRDMVYAVAIAPNKLAHAARLRMAGVDLTVILDSLEAARMAGEAATRAGIDFSVLIEIDVDGHRSGVSPQSEVLRPLARAVAGMPGLQLRGLLTHAGSAYDCESGPGIEEVAERERLLMVGAATVLRDSGIPCREVSVGSTPTALMARSYAGVTEVRAGVFVFNDLMQVRLGLCTMQDIAMSVLCSVIGHQETHHRVIVDAGWTALSQDRQVHGATLIYGLLCDLEGRVMDDLAMTRLNQEHGIVTRPSGAPINSAEFPIGRNLRILPVHACATAAAHDRYHLIPEGAEGIDIWPRFGRWTQ